MERGMAGTRMSLGFGIGRRGLWLSFALACGALLVGSSTALASHDSRHVCGVKHNHKIVCWGNDDEGQSDPKPGEFRSVAAGYDTTCGIRTDAPGAANFRSVGVSEYHACALRLNDTIECWGDDGGYGAVDDAPGGDGFRSISVGGDQWACGVRFSDKVKCW